MELETLIAYMMIAVAVAPFGAVALSKLSEAKRYKNLYGVKG